MSSRNAKRLKSAGDTPPPAAVSDSNQNNAGSILDFAVPTEFVELPSKGILYPKGHPLHNQDTIEIRYMTAKDEDTLTSPALLRKGLAIERLMQNVIVNKDIKADELLVADRSAIIIAARVTGYGADYEAEIGCPSCGESFRNEFDLSEYHEFFSGVNLEDSGFTACDDGTYEIRLPTTGVDVCVRLLNGKDENRMSKAKDLKSKNRLPDSSMTDLFKTIIHSINEVTEADALRQFIDLMPAKDSRFLRNSYQKLVPSVNLSQAVECPSCGIQTETEVPLGATFFWPDS